MEYYSAIKSNTYESILIRLVNLEPIIWSEVSQKEEKINACTWNLERWYQQSYVQGKKWDTDITNKHLDSMGEEGGMIWENSSETYTLQYVKHITSVILAYEAGHQKPVLSYNIDG